MMLAPMRRFSTADLRRFIRVSHHHRLGSFGSPVPAAAAKRTVLMGLGAIRMGQTRLSFELVADKLSELIDAMKGADRVRRYRDLLREGAISGVIGPGRRYAVVEDGNHKLAAMLALDGLILIEPRFAGLRGLLSYCDSSLIPVQVTRDLSSLSEPDFWTKMRTRLFLERLDGSIAHRPPLSPADAEDDPFRLLAARLRARAKHSKQGLKLSGSEYPLWIKMPGGADFIEFRVASVLRTASWAAANDQEQSWRLALMRAAIPDVVVVPERAHAKDVEKALTAGGRSRAVRALRRAAERRGGA